jgi:hypothetical protein
MVMSLVMVSSDEAALILVQESLAGTAFLVRAPQEERRQEEMVSA